MFGWMRRKRPGPAFAARLAERKAQMDRALCLRPWAPFPVERDLLEGMGAFREDAVADSDFREPMEELLDELFGGAGGVEK
jgi:hypothetical protein